MGGETPKQFLEIDGEPIVMRTVRRMDEGVKRFLTACSRDVDDTVSNAPRIPQTIDNTGRNVHNYVHKIVLVLPEEHISLWETLCRRHDFRVPHEVATGGETRFHSVRNGLRTEPEADIVLVHDGVRPLVDDRTIAEVIRTAERHGAAVPVVPVVDSLRRIDPSDPAAETEAVDRTAYRAVQTPQGFRGDWLRQAYAAPYDDRFTDDASVVERTGTGRVVLTEGSPSNLKITTPTDLAIAEIMLRR